MLSWRSANGCIEFFESRMELSRLFQVKNINGRDGTPIMNSITLRRLWPAVALLLTLTSIGRAAILEGTIRNLDTGDPIPKATVRVLNSGLSAAANEEGKYRLKLKPGMYDLKFSHIAYYSEESYLAVPDGDTTISFDIALRPSTIILKKITAYSRAYDPGQRIIVEAIRRKQEILDKLESYRFDAYTKLVASDHDADSADMFAILESQIEAFWRHPNEYKEIIKSRRQTANIEAAENMISVGQILNFNQNRLDMGKYSVVSPTAEDALDHYNYYLLDTLYLDGHPVFHLEIEPKNENNPLFAGTIDIADSTYEVVGVQVTLSKGFDSQFMKNIKYTQTFGEFQDEFWMPIGINFDALLELGLPGIPPIDIDYAASLYDYSFVIEKPKEIFDGYQIEVAETADDGDTTIWSNAQLIPLTDHETSEYRRIDSVESFPKSFGRKAAEVGFGAVFVALFEPRVFRFNRAEGFYFGIPLEFNDIGDRLDLKLETGYAIDAEYWQNRIEADFTISEIPKLSIGAGYRNQAIRRPVMQETFGYMNPTLGALISGHDVYDYYRSEGYNFNLKSSPFRKVSVEMRFNNYRHRSLGNNSDFTFEDWGDDHPDSILDHRPNPAVREGHLRSLSAQVSWDSRPLMKDKGKVRKMYAPEYWQVGIGAEHSDPDLIDSDFDFSRMYGWLFRRQRTLNLGISEIFLYGGYSDRDLPPQRYFTQDFGDGFMTSEMRFKTLDDINFVGDKAVSAYFNHDFGRRLFLLSGVPGIKDIPFSLGIHGGTFFTRFDNLSGPQIDEYHAPSGRWYKELGFSIGGITMLDLKLMFTWQLSDYETSDFSVNMAMGLFRF